MTEQRIIMISIAISGFILIILILSSICALLIASKEMKDE